jgi:hypothetical protein
MTKMPIAVLGIDLGKNSCSVAGLDMHGAVVLRRRRALRCHLAPPTKATSGGLCWLCFYSRNRRCWYVCLV